MTSDAKGEGRGDALTVLDTELSIGAQNVTDWGESVAGMRRSLIECGNQPVVIKSKERQACTMAVSNS